MHISTKTSYALKALAYIALHGNGKPVPLGRICHMQHLPRKYIEQIFLKLRHKGLLNATHGAAGGYYLSRALTEITLADVIHAVDDEVSSKFCPENERENKYCSSFPCGFSRIWDEITKDLESYFNSITLENILSKL